MFKVGQKVVSTESNEEFEKGNPGTVVEVDINDERLPYYVAFLDLSDEEGESVPIWCRQDEIEADGEEE